MAFSFDLWQVLGHVGTLALAYLLALPIGWNRELEERSAGVRTFPLVAMAACGFIILADEVPGASAEDQAQILMGLITGIGFIGGGAILRDGGTVTGTATAASLWSTGAIGAAVGFGIYDIAVILSMFTFATLRYLAPLKKAAQEAKPDPDPNSGRDPDGDASPDGDSGSDGDASPDGDSGSDGDSGPDADPSKPAP